MTATGVMMGTPHYMAPELVQGERATEQADIYALGCVLYQMLAGEVPFTGTTPMVVLNRHVNDQPRPIQERRDDVPRALAAVVARAMEKDPAGRAESQAAHSVYDMWRIGECLWLRSHNAVHSHWWSSELQAC